MKIIDKNKDFYDYLQYTEISDDSVVFVRKESVLWTKQEFCSVLQDNLHTKYDFNKEYRGKNWKSPRQEYYELALVAGFNLFLIHFKNLVYNKEMLVDFKPFLVCFRKNYEWNNVPFGLFRIDQSLDYRWRLRRLSPREFKEEQKREQKWESANLQNFNFEPLLKGKFPILAQTKIPAIIEPEKIFLGIEEYLSSRKNDISMESKNLDDVQKAVNHGFDAKTSFRKM